MKMRVPLIVLTKQQQSGGGVIGALVQHGCHDQRLPLKFKHFT